MRIDIVTIFPDYFGPASADGRVGESGPLGVSLIGKAGARGDIDFRVHDLRSWTTDVHHTVDDTPFGGGPGMVMKPDVWGDALDAVLASAGDSPSAAARLVVPTPSGVPFTQELAAAYAQESRLVFACGRYEGIDSRVVADARTRMQVDEVSIGDYVLAGGEVAVAVIVEAVCRLLPGVLGNEQSNRDDSFGGTGGPMSGLLEGPVYTRPRTWREREVPDVVLSGNHRAIARWQRDESLRRTAVNRPDLIRRLAAAPDGLDKRDRQVLADVGFPVDTENMAH
ncbi:MAG: tRNA ((37)-N1)-methyltransferase TrmD [Actinomycetia bacterium]|nr:tRNA ((37)-N1)-methyltransferase TrmD [Actinomycetes bacterium]